MSSPRTTPHGPRDLLPCLHTHVTTCADIGDPVTTAGDGQPQLDTLDDFPGTRSSSERGGVRLARMMPTLARSPRLWAVLICCTALVTAAHSVRDASMTWDEPYHLAAGISQLQTADPRMQWDHPPLVRVLAALPAVFRSITSIPKVAPEAWASADIASIANASYEQIELHIAPPGRLLLLPLFLLLLAVTYRWASDLVGPVHGLVPLLLVAFCPPVLANAPIVGTDLAITAFGFAATYGWWRFTERPAPGWLLWTAVMTGLAAVSKHSALLLAPIFVLLMVRMLPNKVIGVRADLRWLRQLGLASIVIPLITVVLVHLAYGFRTGWMTGAALSEYTATFVPELRGYADRLASVWPESLPIPLPAPFVLGVMSKVQNVTGGHITSFLGEVSGGGWPNYFLMILLVQLPPAFLALAGSGLVLGTFGGKQRPRDMAAVVLPVAVFLYVLSTGSLMIGIRHALPMLPFLALWAGFTTQAATTLRSRACVVIALVGTMWSTASIHPHYLMYFNWLGGGPDRGWRIAVTGSDYGQNGRALARRLKELGIDTVAYASLGWSHRAVRLAGVTALPVPCVDTGQPTAIHVMRLVIPTSQAERACHAWMLDRTPDEKVGYNIWVYNIPAQR